MDQLLKDAERIKSLEIQGATNVAMNAIDFLSGYAKRLKYSEIDSCLDDLYKAREILINTRPTEPAMRNALNYILANIESIEDIFTEINKRVEEVNKHFDIVKNKIIQIGTKKIKNNMFGIRRFHLAVNDKCRGRTALNYLLKPLLIPLQGFCHLVKSAGKLAYLTINLYLYPAIQITFGYLLRTLN